MHKRVSRAVVHCCWHALVSAIVIAGLCFSLLWLASPGIDDLRPKILEWINTTTGQPIQIENMEVEWIGITPYLKLSDIQILDRNSHKRITHLKQAKLNIDLYRSLTNWKLAIGHLELSGLNVELVHQEDGSISLLGLTEQASNSDVFTHWLVQQPHLKINDSQIVWHELQHQQEQQSLSVRFSDVDLELSNKRLTNTHELSGSARLPDNTGEFEFHLKLKGDPLTSNWNADVTLTTKELDPARYLPININERLMTALQIKTVALNSVRLNSNIRIHWEKASISDLDGDFLLNNTDDVYSLSSHFIAGKATSNDWLISFPKLSIDSIEHHWQNFSLQLKIPSDFSKSEPEFDVQLNRVHIDDLLTVLPESVQRNFKNIQPEGELKDFRLHYNQQTPLIVEGEFSNLKILPYKKNPGFSNLAGTFQGGKDLLTLNLDSHDLILNSISTAGEQEAPVKFDQLNGKVEWIRMEQGWVISTPQITLSNPDLEFQLTGSVKNEFSKSPVLDLQGTFFRGNVEPLVKNIPSNLLHPRLKEWLDRSIVSGYLTGGNVIFRGALDQFPFNPDQQHGVFEVRLNVEEGILDYFKGWPKIEKLAAEVLFNSQSMIIEASGAKINGVDLLNTVVKIPELKTKKRHLLINGNAKGNMTKGLQFVNNSPLKDTIGKQFEHLKVSGILDLDLSLDIPLAKKSKDAPKPESKVKGEIHLNNNTLSLESLGIQLKSVEGDFLFDNNRRWGENLSARLYGNAIKINLDIDKSKENQKSEVSLTGVADKNYIIDRMVQVGLTRENLTILGSVSGTTAWKAQLSLPTAIGDPDAETGLIITSNLKGLNIHAPEPIGKFPDEEIPLTVSTTLSKKTERRIDIQCGHVVKKDSKTDQEDGNNKSGLIDLELNLKKKSSIQNDQYLITINGYINKLDVSAWSDFLDKHSEQDNNKFIPDENWLKYDLAVDHLKVIGQSLEAVQVRGISSQKTWELQLESEYNSGMISLPYQLSDQPVKADFERLELMSSDKKQEIEFTPEKVPEIILTSQSFKYNDWQLGSLQLHTKSDNQGIHLEKLLLASSAATIDVTGNWIKQNEEQQSQFDILANGNGLGPILEQFGFGSSGIEDGETRISINASWPGSPADFDLATLKGNVQLDVGRGRFTKIKNRLGKVIGLLSLESLNRHLSLGFNDLFKGGFVFDKISASFDIERGDAYTNNLNIVGLSANIDVAGRIGLSSQDYDQLITIIPSVAESLPVASALFGPLGAGVGAAIFIAGKVIPILPKTIDKVLKSQYTLKGSWEKPVLESLIVTKKNQPGK